MKRLLVVGGCLSSSAELLPALLNVGYAVDVVDSFVEAAGMLWAADYFAAVIPVSTSAGASESGLQLAELIHTRRPHVSTVLIASPESETLHHAGSTVLPAPAGPQALLRALQAYETTEGREKRQ